MQGRPTSGTHGQGLLWNAGKKKKPALIFFFSGRYMKYPPGITFAKI